jgi:SAM-dependent methyltransferase
MLSLLSRLVFARGQLDTAGVTDLAEIGLGAPGRQEYLASGWFFLRRALKGCRITPEDVFVDFGSGMGRVVYLAARHYPFGRVVGVEISQRFNDVAAENIARMRGKLRCKNVELVTCDATEFVVPDDMTYAYFFNPFTNQVFRKVLDNVIASLDRRPRPITICYANPVMESTILQSGRFIKTRSTAGLRPDIPIYRISVFQSAS